ncbi:MAG: nitrite/sulfite reductase, partial [Thalassovita sp.]
ARIKITVNENGLDEYRALVDERFALIRPQFSGVDQDQLAQIETHFTPPAFRNAPVDGFETAYRTDPVFQAWADTNLEQHKAEGYAIVTVSIKKHGDTPGDATSDQMRVLAELAEKYGHDELRISH